MQKVISFSIKFLLAGLVLLAGRQAVSVTTVLAGDVRATEFRAEFLKLCDVASEELNKATRKQSFYRDSYAVRALAVAYDITGNEKYLDTCTWWSQRMVNLQNRMKPKGAYYMNYGRKPGQTKGDWYAADSGSIAMGVLATAVRCTDKQLKQRYLDSVKAYAKLVIDNYVGPEGGITDGLWHAYDGQWWCSTGIFGSLAFLLYDETGDEAYLKVGLGTIDWLNRLDFRKIKHPYTFDVGAPTVIFYILETYSAGLPRLKPGSERRKAALAQIEKTLQWMSENQGGKGKWNYNAHRGTKHGGIPMHMYLYARLLPQHQDIRAVADRELRYISTLLPEDKKATPSELTVFTMMSYAERVSPGALYRSSKP